MDWEFWAMKHFGAFLANLRNNTGLSQEDLAPLVESSKSALSRLENDEVPQPFKGPIRKTVIALAEMFCASRRETERYLELAVIDRSLLTETEEIQLGFMPRIPIGSPEEVTNLEYLEGIYEQRLRYLEAQEMKLGISSQPRTLKLKIHQHPKTLNNIQIQLNNTNNIHH